MFFPKVIIKASSTIILTNTSAEFLIEINLFKLMKLLNGTTKLIGSYFSPNRECQTGLLSGHPIRLEKHHSCYRHPDISYRNRGFLLPRYPPGCQEDLY